VGSHGSCYLSEKLIGKVFVVRGHVQGVCYRASTLKQAERFGLAGWVKNLSDGSVKLSAYGSQASIAKLEQWLLVGPPYAEVEAVECLGEHDEPCEGFKVVYDS